MPSINMIAPRRAEKRRSERDMRRLAVVILAELVFAVCLGGYVCTKLWATRCQISELEVQVTRMQPKVREIERNELATAKLTPKLELLNKAKERTMRWYNTLDQLTQSMPPSTYLTRLSTVQSTPDNPSISVNLLGVSLSQAKVGEAMIRLQSVPDFKSVMLHYTQKTVISEATAVEFEIGADMKSEELPKEGGAANGSSQS